MVLQGVNLPLAFNGQEAIWQKVFEVQYFSFSSISVLCYLVCQGIIPQYMYLFYQTIEQQMMFCLDWYARNSPGV